MGFNSGFKGLIVQHVSSDTPLIIRSSKIVIAASGFKYVCGCRQLSWLSGNAECHKNLNKQNKLLERL
jgi:hypothetical protein